MLVEEVLISVVNVRQVPEVDVDGVIVELGVLPVDEVCKVVMPGVL